MSELRGLTWDHPRGRRPLEETAPGWVAKGLRVEWSVQPLEGFEDHPIEELAAAFDLVVLDHPHLGDAVAADCFQPIRTLLGDAAVESLTDRFVGPSLASYVVDGELLALPLDAATQVMARDPGRVEEPPTTWSDVIELARDTQVGLSIAGPHALLSLFSVAASFGEPPTDLAGHPWLSDEVTGASLEVLREVQSHAPAGTETLNPIGLLERLASDDELALVPLVYGYVPYSAPGLEHPVRFSDAPRLRPELPPGSTIGGTGVAVSRRATASPELIAYLTWLVADATQRDVIPTLSGQPAARAAWDDAGVDAAAGGFYRSTRASIDAAVVRPRAAGYPGLQAAGSAIARAAILGTTPIAEAVDALGRLASRTPAERRSTA